MIFNRFLRVGCEKFNYGLYDDASEYFNEALKYYIPNFHTTRDVNLIIDNLKICKKNMLNYESGITRFCINCAFCDECIDCESCYGCYGCVDCKKIIKCQDCEFCENCENCENCCGVVKSINLKNCRECIECNDLESKIFYYRNKPMTNYFAKKLLNNDKYKLFLTYQKSQKDPDFVIDFNNFYG